MIAAWLPHFPCLRALHGVRQKVSASELEEHARKTAQSLHSVQPTLQRCTIFFDGDSFWDVFLSQEVDDIKVSRDERDIDAKRDEWTYASPWE